MTGKLIATGDTKLKPQPMTPARMDAEIGRLQAIQVAREGVIDPDEAYGWERLRQRRDREGSYRELERALDTMQIDWPLGRSAINSIYLTEPAARYSPVTERVLVEWIVDRMPERIRVPKRYYQRIRERLVGDIRALAAEGYSDTLISERLELPMRQVSKVTGMIRMSFGNAPGSAKAPGSESI